MHICIATSTAIINFFIDPAEAMVISEIHSLCELLCRLDYFDRDCP